MGNIFSYFSDKKKARLHKNLLDVSSSPAILDRFTTLQNEVVVDYDTKVIAIAGVTNDELGAYFAKAYADTYAHNGTSCLIIDANMYEPRLAEIVGKTEVEPGKVVELSEKVSAIFFNKEIYPGTVIKGGAIHQVVEDNKDKFDHILILLPAIKKHKEVVLVSDIIQTSILVAQKNRTKKKSIFNAVAYFRIENLPLAKTVILA